MSNNLNSISLQGNLVKDPEIKSIGDDNYATDFSIAVSNPGKDKGVSFFACVAYGRTAQVIKEHFHKGKQIVLQGFLKQDRWKNDDGGTRSKTLVQVEKFFFVSGGPRDDSVGQPEASAKKQVPVF